MLKRTSGTYRMFFEMLTRAIDDYFDYKYDPWDTRKNSENNRIAVETSKWFASSDTNWPCSFENVCTGLGINADAVRLGLKGLISWDHVWWDQTAYGKNRITESETYYFQTNKRRQRPC